ncbi:MAG: UvrD-helicase domain-containing protein, partial [Actinomycetia bacterium]|nr:UvrD-helicase domain-containing protein [Actinomycetes bacterium]
MITTLDRNILVNAGAGTGKTHTLTERYVYTLQKDSQTSPRNILAITYTDAAAAELRARIQDRLRRAAHDDHLDPLDAQRLMAHARSMDQSWISTIHAFCARIIRAHALDLDIDPNFVQLDADQAKQMQEDILDSVIKQISVGDAKKPTPLLDLEQLKTQSDKQIDRGIAKATAETLYAHLVLAGSDKRTIAKQIKGILEQCARAGLSSDDVESQPFDPNQSDDKQDSILQAKITIELARRFDEIYQQEKKHNALMDFNDLLARAYELIKNNKHVRESYREQFHYLLIDEFQDTNPFIYDIIDLLADDNMCLVGDSKQSIFGFNGADVSLISSLDQIWDRDETTQVVPLSINYRSTAAVLDFANEFCAHNQMLGDQMQKLSLGREVGENDITLPEATSPVTIVGIDRCGEGSAEMKAQTEANTIAAHLELLHEHGIAWTDMTILVRRHKDAELMLDVLEAHG